MLTVARDDNAADLDGWVTVTNASGTQFRNASLQLVAGNVNRVRQVLGKMADVVARTPRARRGRAGDGAGVVLGLPPLHAGAEDDDQQQPDQAGEHARRHRLPRPQALRRRRPGVLLPQRAASRVAAQGRRAGVLPVHERGEGGARHADAGRRGARVPGRLARRHAVRRRGPHRPHAEGRDAQPQDRHRLRRRRRAQADRLPEDRRRTSTRWSSR